MLKVFVAGASAELDRCRAFVDRVNAHPLMTVTYDWVADVEDFGAPTPTTDDEKLPYASADLGGINTAHVLAALCPRDGKTSTGLWFEICQALHAGVTPILCGPASHFLYTCLVCEITTGDDDDLFRVLEDMAEQRSLVSMPALGEA